MSLMPRLPARSGFLPTTVEKTTFFIGWDRNEKKFVWETNARKFGASISVVHPTPQFNALLDRYTKHCRHYYVQDILPSFCDLATELVRSLEQSVLSWPDDA